MQNHAVQKDFYLFLVGNVYYAQFRDPATRKLLPKKSSGLRRETLADKWAKNEYDRLCGEAGKSGLTLAEYAGRFYIDGCPHETERKTNGRTFGVKTKLDNRHRLEAYIMPDPICKMRLCDITRPDVLDFRDRLIEKLGYTRKAQLTLVAYKNIMHSALNRGLIDNDPTIVKINIAIGKKKQRAATSIDNVKNILLKKYWPNKTIWLAALTAGITGLRAGEISGLTWGDVDKTNEKILISRSINLYEGEKSTKSRKPRETVYPKVLQVILEPHRGGPGSYIFSIKDGKPLAYSALRSAMTRAMNKVIMDNAAKNGIINEDELKTTKITLHGLRHSINTALLEAGVNPELFLASFGWVDKETQEIYTHRDLYNLAPQREATDKLFEGFIGGE